MKNRIQARVGVIASICLTLVVGSAIYAQTQFPQSNATQKGAAMTTQARGTFDVKLNPLDPYNQTEGANLARMSLDKQFHGDLEATSKGEMLSAGTDVKGSAGYVAMERISGTLRGRNGSFVLQHNATMTRGAPYMNIVVVPDSGTGQLKGLVGKMLIVITESKHSY